MNQHIIIPNNDLAKDYHAISILGNTHTICQSKKRKYRQRDTTATYVQYIKSIYKTPPPRLSPLHSNMVRCPPKDSLSCQQRRGHPIPQLFLLKAKDRAYKIEKCITWS